MDSILERAEALARRRYPDQYVVDVVVDHDCDVVHVIMSGGVVAVALSEIADDAD
jgi:hypothetical protein